MAKSKSTAPDPGTLTKELKKVRAVVATACGAIANLDIEDSDEIRTVLIRFAEDPLTDLIDLLEASHG